MIVVANCLKAPKDLGAWIEHMFALVPDAVEGVAGFGGLSLRKVEPEGTDCVVYVDLTMWDERSFFEDWRRSQAFEMAHAQAREHRDTFRLLHPRRYLFEHWTSLDVQHVDRLLIERLANDYPGAGISAHARFREMLTIGGSSRPPRHKSQASCGGDMCAHP